MITGTKHVSIFNIINSVYRDLNLSEPINIVDAVEWAGEALELIGAALYYQEVVEVLLVKDYKAKLPVGLHYIETAGGFVTEDILHCPESNQFTQMKYSTDAYHHSYCKNNKDCLCISNLTYKVNEDYIFPNFETGFIKISYKRIPIDNEGYPSIPDDIKFRRAVSYYLQEKIGFIKWSQGKMPEAVYRKIEVNKEWAMGAANTSANMPSVDMMESIKNNWIRLIPKINQHSDGFKSMNIQEQRYTHNTINNASLLGNPSNENTFFNYSDGARPINITGAQAELYSPKDGELIYVTQTSTIFTLIGYYKWSVNTQSWIKL